MKDLYHHRLNILYKQCVAAIEERENRVWVWEKEALFCLVLWYLWIVIWNSERCLLLLISVVWWFALSWYVATFGFTLWLSLWFVRNSHLVFGICEPLVLWFVFGSLVLYLWERAIWVYLGFRFVRLLLHQFVLCQICYSKICSSSTVNVSYCWTT